MHDIQLLLALALYTYYNTAACGAAQRTLCGHCILHVRTCLWQKCANPFFPALILFENRESSVGAWLLVAQAGWCTGHAMDAPSPLGLAEVRVVLVLCLLCLAARGNNTDKQGEEQLWVSRSLSVRRSVGLYQTTDVLASYGFIPYKWILYFFIISPSWQV